MIDSRAEAKLLEVLVVIPTYNNAGTIAAVIGGVREYVDDVLVVNDGSTDDTAEILAGVSGVHVLTYPENRGKGFALRTAMKYASEKGFRYVITIDSDGQHYPDDILNFLTAIKTNPDTLIVGARNIQADNMPSKNTFANKFSNFWYFVETGLKMDDTQSGYRLYPVKKLQNLRFVTARYEFELEIIVRAVWSDVKVVNMPVKVYYPPTEERVSHFKPLRDFGRISLLNCALVPIALIYYHPKCFVKRCNYTNLKIWLNKHVLKTTDSNIKVALSIGLGIFFGIFPIWGYQMITAGIVAHFLKLNKVITVLSSNISIPPMIPFIIYGSYLMGGVFVDRSEGFEWSQMTLNSVKTDLWQYAVGSTVLAVVCGCIVFIVSYLMMLLFKRQNYAE